MNKLFQWIKHLFLFEKPLYISSKYTIYNDISLISFVDELLVQAIYNDLIILIVNNNFIVDPSKILAFYEHNYDFTQDELTILAFKLGIITTNYVTKPVLLLNAAVKLTHIFTKDRIEYIQSLLDQQILDNEHYLVKEYDAFKIKKDKEEEEIKLKANDPDALIDDWVRKNKKR